MSESRFHFLEIGRVRRRAVVAPAGEAVLVPPTRLRLAETIGSFGAALGQFNTPAGLFIDADANVYVADSRNNRVQKITPSGDVYGMGGPGILSLPQAVVVDSTGFIYITELGGHRFRKFGPRGQFVFCMGGPSGSLARFSSPTALCMDAYHHLYIADTDNGRITCYSATGHWRTDYHSPTSGTEFKRPQGVAVDQQGRIFVADTLNHRIVRLAPDGTLDLVIGKPGPAPGELAEPRGLAADDDGGLWVADSGNDRVQKFDEEGGLVCCFPERPTPGLDLSTPSAVAVDGQGGVYVSDTMNHRLLRLATVGDD
jgi:DNA-binding beta-propeller fold protein YncE